MRERITAVMVVVGVLLMGIGYFASAPWGAESVANSNPRFDFSPLLFVVGVIVAFSAALVYELLPDRRES